MEARLPPGGIKSTYEGGELDQRDQVGGAVEGPSLGFSNSSLASQTPAGLYKHRRGLKLVWLATMKKQDLQCVGGTCGHKAMLESHHGSVELGIGRVRNCAGTTAIVSIVRKGDPLLRRQFTSKQKVN